MKRTLLIMTLVLLAPPCPAASGPPCRNDGSGEIGHCWSWPWCGHRTAVLLQKLRDPCPDVRFKAAVHLGCCCETNAATHPEIVPALVQALQGDSCWQVRRQAAWSLAYQNACNRCGWASLFVASKLDPHWAVRDSAANAIKVIEPRIDEECIRQLGVWGKSVVAQFENCYQPGKISCAAIFAVCCGGN